MSDPTKSQTLRRNYARRLRGWYASLNAEIRDAIVSRDIFGLQESFNEEDPSPPPMLTQMSQDRQQERFMDWLEQQEERGILQIITRDDNQYVRQAYSKGVSHADSAMARQGISVPEEAVGAMFNRPIHRDTLESLYTRNFREIDGITSRMNQQIGRELADGFSQGLHSSDIARNITDTVDDVGKRWATQMAHTEVVRAHSDSTLNRFEEMGVEEVTVDAEILTAGDDKVCPVCEALEGTVMSVQEAREGSFTHDGDTYPKRPPFHGWCRCAIIPVT